MMLRMLFAVVALAALGTLFYLQQSDNGGGEAIVADVESTEPGYIANGAELIETDDDGHPLFQLEATRIRRRAARYFCPSPSSTTSPRPVITGP